MLRVHNMNDASKLLVQSPGEMKCRQRGSTQICRDQDPLRWKSVSFHA